MEEVRPPAVPHPSRSTSMNGPGDAATVENRQECLWMRLRPALAADISDANIAQRKESNGGLDPECK
mgnify:CR=1 FL=1